MDKKEKLSLIRKAENVFGFSRFSVSAKSTNDELNQVIEHIMTVRNEMTDGALMKQIEEAFEEEDL